MSDNILHQETTQDVKSKCWTIWDAEGTYKWDNSSSREESYIIDPPPPTVSGTLHIGHVMSYSHIDFIARFHRMRGMNVFFPIGFDDNGLPTERLVEQRRGIRAFSMDRAEFIKICMEEVKLDEDNFRNLFRTLGLSIDWGLEYTTISQHARSISQMSFLDLAMNGQVYRASQPILWDTIDQTAIAQAEVVDKEVHSQMYRIKFNSTFGEDLIIASTRPELLPACVALLYHPEDKRYKNLKGHFAISPLFGVRVPILPDEAVVPDKGTGLVMCCTFGDTLDISWWRKHNLPLRIILNKEGKIIPIKFDESCTDILHAENVVNNLVGLHVLEARIKIINMLKNLDLIVWHEDILHTVKCAERSGALLEIITTPQWFINSLQHKDAMLNLANHLNWYPKHMKAKLDAWINSILWDWCISRQRPFGVPIPVWYSKRQHEYGKVILPNYKQLPVDPLVDLPHGYNRDEVEPDLDVMDTWATSSVSPQISSYGISSKFCLDAARHQKLFPAHFRPQGHEILRTWAFSTILKSYLHTGVLPWSDIMVSGWCLAEDKSKMSKSKGNIVTAQHCLDTYGPDVVRYWSATAPLGSDTAFSIDVINNGKRLINKLRNAAKFTSIHIRDITNKNLESLVRSGEISSTMDLWMLAKLNETISSANTYFNLYEYNNARKAIEDLFWQSFCDNYLEIIKIRIYDTANLARSMSAKFTLSWVFHKILRLFAPFLPFVTEEIYQHMYKSGFSIHTKGNWPHSIEGLEDYLEVGGGFISVLEAVRKAKADQHLSVKSPILTLEITKKFDDDAIQDLMNVTSSSNVKTVAQFTYGGYSKTPDVNIFF